jgi:hypothetical protein
VLGFNEQAEVIQYFLTVLEGQGNGGDLCEVVWEMQVYDAVHALAPE